ncbi:MAG: hypothetical protein JOY95_10310 [Silvibacterium sp.]|nr:hypothetical protein [Silvibacterium sp.]
MPQQKTFWHLLPQRRMPTEYEVVTSKLLLNTREGYTGRRFELDVPLQPWYAKYQQGSLLTCSNWENFRDPRETTYSKYTDLQMQKEIFVDGILEEIESTGYDRELSAQWIEMLDDLAVPLRYPGHAFMMIAAYIGQIAPCGRITVAAALQASDEARRVERLAYRIRQIQLTFPEFGLDGKNRWELGQRWQPLRRFVEQLLVTYDWGEAFVVLNLILKPMVDELFMKHVGDLALGQNDHLLGQIFYSLNEDCQWHRDWSRALVQTLTADNPSNNKIIQNWIKQWRPRALEAVDAFADLFESKPLGQGDTLFHNLTGKIDDFGAECLQNMALERI